MNRMNGLPGDMVLSDVSYSYLKLCDGADGAFLMRVSSRAESLCMVKQYFDSLFNDTDHHDRSLIRIVDVIETIEGA